MSSVVACKRCFAITVDRPRVTIRSCHVGVSVEGGIRERVGQPSDLWASQREESSRTRPSDRRRSLLTCCIKWQRMEDADAVAEPPRIKPPAPPAPPPQHSVPVRLHASTSPFPNEASHFWVSYRAII